MGLKITHDAFSKLLSQFCDKKNFTRGENLVDYKSFCIWLKTETSNEMKGTAMVKIVNRFQELTRESIPIWETYAMFDMHHLGEISLPEFRESSRQLGLPITAEEMYIATQPYKGKCGILYKAFLTNCGVPEPILPATMAATSKQYLSPAGWVKKKHDYPDEAHGATSNPNEKETHAKNGKPCFVCAFRNTSNASSCTMCGTSLRLNGTKRPQNPVPSPPALGKGLNTGWLT